MGELALVRQCSILIDSGKVGGQRTRTSPSLSLGEQDEQRTWREKEGDLSEKSVREQGITHRLLQGKGSGQGRSIVVKKFSSIAV